MTQIMYTPSIVPDVNNRNKFPISSKLYCNHLPHRELAQLWHTVFIKIKHPT